MSTPGNAKYGQFLSAAQYRATFSPAQSDVDAVSAWLKAQGFRVGYVPDNHKYVEAVGSLAKASSAFGTSFSDYTVQGQRCGRTTRRWRCRARCRRSRPWSDWTSPRRW